MSYVYCCNCNEIFNEADADSRPAELEDGREYGSKIMLCPYCGSEELEEAGICERCGTPILPDEHLCECCEDDLYGAVQNIIESYQGDVLDAQGKFFDYLERRWF